MTLTLNISMKKNRVMILIALHYLSPLMPKKMSRYLLSKQFNFEVVKNEAKS